MHSTTFLCFLLNALAAQKIINSPVQLEERSLQVTEVQVAAYKGTDSGPSKRSLTVVNVDPQIDPTNSKRSLEARKYGYKTDHCGVNGRQWMPLVAAKPTDNGVNDAIEFLQPLRWHCHPWRLRCLGTGAKYRRREPDPD